MAEIRESPFRSDMALRAVIAKQAEVPVFGGVARRAIQQCFLRLQMAEGELRRHADFSGLGFVQLWRASGFIEPAFNLCNVGTALLWLAFELFDADACECNVIHLRRPCYRSLVFEMAGGTLPDVGVESTRLALQDCKIVGVANDAVLRLDAFHRRVAGGAVAFEESMAF